MAPWCLGNNVFDHPIWILFLHGRLTIHVTIKGCTWTWTCRTIMNGLVRPPALSSWSLDLWKMLTNLFRCQIFFSTSTSLIYNAAKPLLQPPVIHKETDAVDTKSFSAQIRPQFPSMRNQTEDRTNLAQILHSGRWLFFPTCMKPNSSAASIRAEAVEPTVVVLHDQSS